MKSGSSESNNEIVHTDKAYVFAKNAFYPVEMKDLYLSAGSWPDDGVEVSEDVFNEFSGNPPDGKVRVEGENGMPEWADIPPPSDEIVSSHNEARRDQLMNEATTKISILTDATDQEVMGDDILPEDIDMLKKWKWYRVKLSKMTEFLNPVWPVKPE